MTTIDQCLADFRKCDNGSQKTLVDMPEFDGLPQPFKDSYHKNMPLVSSAYWNKFSGEWDHLPPDQKEKALAQMDAQAQQMVTSIKTAAPKTSGYAMEGSYLGGLVSTKKDWTLIMILFVLVLLLWTIAKKM
jgi:hypothetical protein